MPKIKAPEEVCLKCRCALTYKTSTPTGGPYRKGTTFDAKPRVHLYRCEACGIAFMGTDTDGSKRLHTLKAVQQGSGERRWCERS
jgi:hypothetical protein